MKPGGNSPSAEAAVSSSSSVTEPVPEAATAQERENNVRPPVKGGRPGKTSPKSAKDRHRKLGESIHQNNRERMQKRKDGVDTAVGRRQQAVGAVNQLFETRTVVEELGKKQSTNDRSTKGER